jgi:hypothetical protein
MASRVIAAVALLSAAFAILNTAWTAWYGGETYDEKFHLEWSRRLLDEGVTQRDPTRFNSKTPASIPNVLALGLAGPRAAADPRLGRFVARLPTVLWLVTLLGLVFLFGRWLAGPAAGWLALAGTALDPNLHAHGSLVTVDVTYAAATLASLWAAAVYACRPSLARAAAIGVALGVALATKFTALLLVAGLVFLPLAVTRGSGPAFRRLIGHAGAAATVAMLLLCAAYLFNGVARPLGEIPFTAGGLLGAAASRVPGLRLPLPQGFLTGLDASLASERGWGSVVLLGRSYPGGVFYYFPVLWALKTPLAVLALQVAGLAGAVRGRLCSPVSRLLAANLLLTVAYFSFLFRAQIGYRFVLMLVPVGWLLAAEAVSRWKPRPLAAAALAMALLGVAEMLPYVGNPLSFTNLLVWPKRDAYRFVADSNIDWGQNRDRIEGWLAARGVAVSRLDPLHVLAGPNVLGVNAVAGVFDAERYRWVRENLRPLDHLGHTYLLYDVSEEDLLRSLDAQRRSTSDEQAPGRSVPPRPGAR